VKKKEQQDSDGDAISQYTLDSTVTENQHEKREKGFLSLHATATFSESE